MSTWFRRRVNRALCLQLLAMLAVAIVWWIMQILPAIPRGSENELFFGEPHIARQSPLFGRVSFRINGDNEATFVLLMNPANREEFNLWFGPDQALRIEARRTWGAEWIVTSLGSNVGELDHKALHSWRMGMVIASAVLVFCLVWMFLWTFREYKNFYRHRPWFRIRP